MTPSDAPEPLDTATLLTRAGWMRVLESILAGLSHDLSNHAASLDGLIYLLPEGDQAVRDQVGPEVRRLEGCVLGLRALLGNLEAEPEALIVADVVGKVEGLNGIRRDLGMVTVEYAVADALPPVLANPTCLARILLVVIDEVVSATLPELRGEVRVDATGSPLEVHFCIGSGTERSRLRPKTSDALRELITPAGWTLDERSGSVCLSLPSLARAREMEA